MTCERCSAKVPPGHPWCLSCGRWVSSERGVCDGDELAETIGACAVCGRPVCSVCAKERDGKTYCDDPTHQQLLRDHDLLQACASEFEAEWIHRNLMNEGIATILFAYRSWPGYYALALPREASVFVRRGDAARAAEILERYTEEKGA